MRVLITAVGHRTEHWTELFEMLAEQEDVELTLVTGDVTERTRRHLCRLAGSTSRVTYHHLPHVLSEARTGHMASVVFDPRALRAVHGTGTDVVHVIGEAGYLSTRQVLRWRDRRCRTAALTCYAAQNVLSRYPPPFPWLERRAYRAVDEFFAVSEAARTVLWNKGYRGRSTIVPLGVDTRRFAPAGRPPPERPFTVGFVGRLEPHKGIDDLLRAVEQVGCELLVIGAGSQIPAVRAAAGRGRITLHEWVDHADLPALLHRMDVLVLPSKPVVQRNVVPWIGIPLQEQFGRVLVEAMACGIPVLGSDVGEIPNVVGDAGLIFPAGDADVLAARIRWLRDRPTAARRLGVAGTARAKEHFGWDRVAEQMAGIWRAHTNTTTDSDRGNEVRT